MRQAATRPLPRTLGSRKTSPFQLMDLHRPIALKVAVAVLLLEAIANCALTLIANWMIGKEASGRQGFVLMISSVVLVAGECTLLWLLYHGRAWARLLLAVALAALWAPFVYEAATTPGASGNMFQQVRDDVSLLLVVSGIALSFLRSSSRWLSSARAAGA